VVEGGEGANLAKRSKQTARRKAAAYSQKGTAMKYKKE
jgi:hypothetical protein